MRNCGGYGEALARFRGSEEAGTWSCFGCLHLYGVHAVRERAWLCVRGRVGIGVDARVRVGGHVKLKILLIVDHRCFALHALMRIDKFLPAQLATQ